MQDLKLVIKNLTDEQIAYVKDNRHKDGTEVSLCEIVVCHLVDCNGTYCRDCPFSENEYVRLEVVM